jgi:hypothetical protein
MEARVQNGIIQAIAAHGMILVLRGFYFHFVICIIISRVLIVN